MTHMDIVIKLHGVDATPYYESKGAAGSYGDRAVTWTPRAAEKAVIQPVWSMRQSQIFKGVAGAVDSSSYGGVLKSDSAVEAGDYLLVGSVKYEVVQIIDATTFGGVSHKEALLRVMEEG